MEEETEAAGTKMSKTVIFLDIDGVLCTLRAQFAYGDGLLMQSWDITCCQMLRRLCMQYDVSIVVSSTWRKNSRDIRTYFCVYGLIEFLYKTKEEIEKEKVRFQLLNERGSWRTAQLPGIRGNEIDDWLSKHPDVTHYLIIDDDRDFHDHHLPYHIMTDTDEGFSSANYRTCEKFLKEWKDGA